MQNFWLKVGLGVLGLFVMIPQVYADEAADDAILRREITRGRFAALPRPAADPEARVRLGHRLFTDATLSGNRDIACVICHHPRNFTMDSLPLSIGAGGVGMGPTRQQRDAPIIRRNSPGLFNLGQNPEIPMFWDGRVSYSKRSHSFDTPEPALNGYHPNHPARRHPIARALDGALAAQALFPMVSFEEMRGKPGTNEIADARDNLEAWRLIMVRIGADASYREQFKQAYPEVDSFENFNIGHAGTAIAAFERQAFTSVDTSMDRYIQGDSTALTPSQKRGAVLFATKGRCLECHKGPNLTAFDFATDAVPQLGVDRGDGLPADDMGRIEVENPPWDREQWRYSFRIPPLRNVSLTGPYMHNGVFATLREVVAHYSNPRASLAKGPTVVTPVGFREQLVTDATDSRSLARMNRLDPRLVNPIRFTEDEIESVVEFLREGLTEVRFKPYMPPQAR